MTLQNKIPLDPQIRGATTCKILKLAIHEVGGCHYIEIAIKKKKNNTKKKSCKISATASQIVRTLELKHLWKTLIHSNLCTLVSCFLLIDLSECKNFHWEGVLEIGCSACCCPLWEVGPIYFA